MGQLGGVQSGTVAERQAVAPDRREAERGPDILPLVSLAVLAFLLRLVPVLMGGGLTGAFAYDDEVYFSAAVALAEGRIPYRDFVLVHPPGILYLLAPFAWLGGLTGDTTAFATARVAFMLLGAVNTVLVALVARSVGRLAAVCAAGLYAVWIVPITVERSTWLIGPQNTFILLALLLLAVDRPGSLTVRSASLAGAFIALAGVVQLWTVIPAAVVLGWLLLGLWRDPPRLARVVSAYVLSGLATAFVLLLPFLLATGGTMVRLTVFAQLGRSGTGHVSRAERIADLVGLPLRHAARDAPLVLVIIGCTLALMLVALYVARREPRLRLWVALLLTQGAVLLLTTTFFHHYGAWLAPAASLAAGGSVAWLLGRTRGGWRIAGMATYGVVLGALLVLAIRPAGTAIPVSTTEPDLGAARCVTADSPILLMRTETLRRDLRRGCPLEVDPKGASHVTRLQHPGAPPQRRRDPVYQQAMATYFGSSDAALFFRLGKDGLTGATLERIARTLPIRTEIGPVTVYRRVGP